MARRVGRSVSFADGGVYIPWGDEKELQETLSFGMPDIFSPLSMGFEEWEP